MSFFRRGRPPKNRMLLAQQNAQMLNSLKGPAVMHESFLANAAATERQTMELEHNKTALLNGTYVDETLAGQSAACRP